MKEVEFLDRIDRGFANIGYEIQKGRSSPFVRLDRYATNGFLSYSIEAESDASRFAGGIRQLTMSRNRSGSAHEMLDVYTGSHALVLAIPDCSYRQIAKAEGAGIRVLEAKGLQKLLNARVARPQALELHNDDLAWVKKEIQEAFWDFQIENNKSTIVLEFTYPKASIDGNWFPLLRVIASDRKFYSISFIPGIKELTVREGRRYEDSPEWEALKKRIPSNLALEELRIGQLRPRLEWQTYMLSDQMAYPVLEKMYSMAFGEIEPHSLEYKMYECVNPFVLAYDKPF